MLRLALIVVGPIVGIIQGQRSIGTDCQFSPTLAADVLMATMRLTETALQTPPAPPVTTASPCPSITSFTNGSASVSDQSVVRDDYAVRCGRMRTSTRC
jgi:hypothetical protein